MKKRSTVVLLLLSVLTYSLCLAQTKEDEEKTIVTLIREAYIGGAYNDADTRAMSKGFHDKVTIQDVNRFGYMTTSLKQWQILLDRQKWLRPDWNNRTTADIKVLGLEGHAAVVRVDVYNDKVLELTDFLSLYKFQDGWKVTNRIFTRHQAPPEIQQKRLEEWEKAINRIMQPPEKVMNAIGVKPGMVIGEIGAGHGRYTVLLAGRVGNTGKIYANDINENALSHLRDRCKRENILNVETILGKEDNPLFPEQSLDMAFMVWVYHGFDTAPITLLKNLKPALKPGAPLIIIEPVDSEINTEREAFGIEASSDRPATILEKIKKESGEAGFELLRVETFLPRDYICILNLKEN